VKSETLTVMVVVCSEPPAPVPATVTVYEPTRVLPVVKIVRVHVAVVPASGTGLTLKDVPSPGEETAAERLTEQQYPFRLDRVIATPEDDPSGTVSTVGPALIVKSTMSTEMVRECEREPRVAVIVTE
jgi:hypothetical protein